MDSISQYIKPELLVVSAVMYLIGISLKKCSWMKDKYIPVTLGGISIILCAMWVFATSQTDGIKEVMIALFTSFTQGILAAGLSTYMNQMIKQAGKVE